jgi:hypothetical protein
MLPAMPKDVHQTDYVRHRRRCQALEYERSALRKPLHRLIANRLRKESPMEDDFNNIDHEGDPIDRELNALLRETADKEGTRRAVIQMLVMLGSDAMLDHDV